MVKINAFTSKSFFAYFGSILSILEQSCSNFWNQTSGSLYLDTILQSINFCVNPRYSSRSLGSYLSLSSYHIFESFFFMIICSKANPWTTSVRYILENFSFLIMSLSFSSFGFATLMVVGIALSKMSSHPFKEPIALVFYSHTLHSLSSVTSNFTILIDSVSLLIIIQVILNVNLNCIKILVLHSLTI